MRMSCAATYGLIPGGRGDPWEWHRLVSELASRGQDAIAVRLPADDDTAGWSEYADAVVDAIGDRADVILVAASMGAIVDGERSQSMLVLPLLEVPLMAASVRRLVAAGLLVTAMALGSVFGTARPAAQTAIKEIRFSDTKLKNGLRVIISEDRAAPVFAIAVNYNVGSRDERKGRTGFAHLFEHMMFKGSENVGPGEHPYLIFTNGGSMNGTTNKERTLYFEILPANQLDLALFLEADRMRSLEITAPNLENQRQAVQEERRLGVDNQPYGKTFEVRDELAYDNFPYEHSVIGSMADLSAATVDDVASFFKTYYAPNNAVLSIVGDVDTKVTLDKVRRYFESIPSQPAPPVVTVTEPAQTEERRTTIADGLARLARLDMAFKIPPGSSPDADALRVLATVLSNGRSSRFYEAIVRQKQLAPNVAAFSDENRGPGLFSVIGTVAPGKAVADLEAAIDAEIERVKTGPIEPWEMEKARNNARSQLVNSLGTVLGRAIALGQDALFYDQPGRLNTTAARIAKVTPEDVQRVARQYLVKTGRTVVITEPKAAPAKGGL
jgi:zinc protease